MKHLIAYIEAFNEAYTPPYKLILWGPFSAENNKVSIGLELQLLYDKGFQTLFIVSDESEDMIEKNISSTELRIIDAFRKIDFNQYLKQWKEN